MPLGLLLAAPWMAGSIQQRGWHSMAPRWWSARDSADPIATWTTPDRTNARLPGTIELSALDGRNGFSVNGISRGDYAGSAVSGAGDVNGDGFDDILIGAYNADPHGYGSGQSYVIYGRPNVSATVDLSALSGKNGFRANGFARGFTSGKGVSGGKDVNGDGFDDILIAAPFANPHNDPNGNGAGQSFLVYGGTSIPSVIELSSLDGRLGLHIDGVSRMEFSRQVSGAGDVNNDGFDDILIGGPGTDTFNPSSGRNYLVYGASALPGAIELAGLNGINGFRMDGSSGGSVSGAGDVNGDSFDDMLVGGRTVDQSFVVYGGSALPQLIELETLRGARGFQVNDIPPGGGLGFTVSGAGDLNGDDFDDILMSSPFNGGHGTYAGQSYVVFGGPSVPGTVELSALNGSDGFLINGVTSIYLSVMSVSGAGDLNADGFDDIVIGAPRADPDGLESGQCFVVYGASTMPAKLDVTALDGTGGFVLNGASAHDGACGAVSSAGDFNGDGFDDLLIGASHAHPNGGSSGQAYVVFGSDERPARPYKALFPSLPR